MLKSKIVLFKTEVVQQKSWQKLFADLFSRAEESDERRIKKVSRICQKIARET